MQRLTWLALASAAVLACASPYVTPTRWQSVSPAPDRARVIGRVTSSHRRVPLMARALPYDSAGTLVDSTLAEPDGGFVLSSAHGGPHGLRLLFIGHGPVMQRIHLRPGRVDTVRVGLKRDDRFLISDCVGPNGGFGQQFCKR
jgi:hypothetical protein